MAMTMTIFLGVTEHRAVIAGQEYPLWHQGADHAGVLGGLAVQPAVGRARDWAIAREGAARFGGSARLYFNQALRLAWAE